MPLVEVRCPSCHAPVDAPANAPALKCRFCGSSLRQTNASAPAVYTESVPCLVLDRVGPSNHARAWELLTKIGKVPPDIAETAIRKSPGDVPHSFHGFSGREEFLAALREAGISARFEIRAIEVPPPPPDRSVHLDAIGANKGAVMKVIRERLECGAYDAKALVERAPCVLAAALEEGRAKAFVEALTTAGAEARLDEPI